MSVEQLVGCRWNERSDAVEYARLALDAGDGPDVAGTALIETAYITATIAEYLATRALAEGRQAGFDDAGSG